MPTDSRNVSSNADVVAFGMTCCEFWTYNCASVSFTLRHALRDVPDCILDVAVTDHLVAIGTAHNVVYLYDRSLRYLRKVRCQDSSLLYSMRLHVTDDKLRIASGTVFGDVLVWSCNVNDANVDGDEDDGVRNVLHRFLGHKGAVFCVTWHPNGEMLLSTSDDRTLRIWSLKRSECVGVGYGHTARVWRACFADDGYVTAGEDGTVRMWTGDAQLRDTIGGHRGNVWALVVSEGRRIIFSGGEDGDLRVSRLDRNVTSTLAVPIPAEIVTMERDVVGVYFSNETQLSVLVLRGGIVATLSAVGAWRVLYAESGMEVRASCMLPDQRNVAVVLGKGPADRHGIVIVPLDGPVSVMIPSRGLFKIWAVQRDESLSLFAFDGSHIRRWRITLPSFTHVTEEAALPSPNANISALTMVGDVVVVGDTGGGLAVYDTAFCRIPGAHGRSIVKQIVALDPNAFLSMGADGRLRQYDLPKGRAAAQPTCVVTLRSLNALAESLYVGAASLLYTAGFNGANNEYHVTSVRSGSAFARFTHHGPRAATCLTLSAPVTEELPLGADFRYVTTLDGTLQLVTASIVALPSSNVIRLGSTRHPFHSRRINAVQWVAPTLACSVAEDGTCRLTSVCHVTSCFANATLCSATQHVYVSSCHVVALPPYDLRFSNVTQPFSFLCFSLDFPTVLSDVGCRWLRHIRIPCPSAFRRAQPTPIVTQFVA